MFRSTATALVGHDPGVLCPVPRGFFHMSALQKLVDEWMTAHRLSAREVAARSGGMISHQKVADIRNGVVPARGYTARILEGLCLGLTVNGKSIRLEQIREAAGLRSEVPTEYKVRPKYKDLRPELHGIVDAAFEAAWKIQQEQDNRDRD